MKTMTATMVKDPVLEMRLFIVLQCHDSRKRFLQKCDSSTSSLSLVLSGKRPISPEMLDTIGVFKFRGKFWKWQSEWEA